MSSSLVKTDSKNTWLHWFTPLHYIYSTVSFHDKTRLLRISRPFDKLQKSLGLLANDKYLSAFFKKYLSALVQKFPERQQIFSFLFFVEFSLQKSSTNVFLN